MYLKDRKIKTSEINTNNSDYLGSDMSFFNSVKKLFGERSFNIIMIFFCVYGMVNWLIYGWLPTFLKDHFHLNLGEA